MSILSGFALKVGVTIMRFLLIGLAAAMLALPPSAQGVACEGYSASAQTTAADLSAAAKKKTTKKTVVKKKKEKVEYMRAAPMPPGAK
jgi:hypothetical protein